MKLMCTTAAAVTAMERPELNIQSIRELKEAGIQEFMYDFDIISPMRKLLPDKNVEKRRARLETIRNIYERSIKGLAAESSLPSIAKLPFIDITSKAAMAVPDEMVLKLDTDCIKACEEMGCRTVIVQPLLSYRAEDAWEKNRKFLLALALECKKQDTKILLINQCRSVNGHMVRGVCSNGKTAAEWVDRLNRESGEERFGFCLDIGSCSLCGQDVHSMASALGKRMDAVILTESDGRTMARLLPFAAAQKTSLWTCSATDWLGVARGLRDAAFDGTVILDPSDTLLSFPPLIRNSLFPVCKKTLDYFVMQLDIENDLRKYKKIVLFGAGNMCRSYLKCYGEKYPPLFTCDNNPRRWGRDVDGLEVKDPEVLRELPEDCGVIICNIYYNEIAAQLRSMGIINIGYFNDEYLPSYPYGRMEREW